MRNMMKNRQFTKENRQYRKNTAILNTAYKQPLRLLFFESNSIQMFLTTGIEFKNYYTVVL